jgi:nitrous oxidase accessory protein NosD
MRRALTRALMGGATTLMLLALSLPAANAGAVPVPDNPNVVDDDGFAEEGNCASTESAFPTIQEAVTAASAGDTIHVCRGSYEESVIVDRTLTLLGAKDGVDARSRASTAESVVDPPGTVAPGFSLQADDIVVDGFTFEGADDHAGVYTSPTFAGYTVENNIVRGNTIGVYLGSAGGNLTIVRRNLLEDNNVAGSSSGNGIYSDQGAKGILIRVNEFNDNTNSGILFANAGVDQNNIVIQRNRGSDNATFVTLFDTTNSQVLLNRHTDTTNADDGDQGSAIFVGGDNQGVLVQQNRLVNPAFSGIAVRDTLGTAGNTTNIDVLDNVVINAENRGLDVTAEGTGAVQARFNELRDNDVDGIFFGDLTEDNLIRRNVALTNGVLDCHDDSSGTNTAGTANFWRRNVGNTDSPNGLCRPPAA